MHISYFVVGGERRNHNLAFFFFFFFELVLGLDEVIAEVMALS